MKKYEFYVSLGFGDSASHKDVIELEDNLSESEITEIYVDWRNNYLDGYWEEIE